MTDNIDQRPPLERAAESIADARADASGLRGIVTGMIARGELQKGPAERLSKAIVALDGRLMAALSAVGEASS
jgi:hypothetical protein